MFEIYCEAYLCYLIKIIWNILLLFQGTYHFNFPRCATHRAKFLIDSVEDLRINLQKVGSNLMVRFSHPLDAIKHLVCIFQNSEAPVSSVVYQNEVTSEETDLEDQIKQFCKDEGIRVNPVWGLTMFHRYITILNIIYFKIIWFFLGTYCRFY